MCGKETLFKETKKKESQEVAMKKETTGRSVESSEKKRNVKLKREVVYSEGSLPFLLYLF